MEKPANFRLSARSLRFSLTRFHNGGDTFHVHDDCTYMYFYRIYVSLYMYSVSSSCVLWPHTMTNIPFTLNQKCALKGVLGENALWCECSNAVLLDLRGLLPSLRGVLKNVLWAMQTLQCAMMWLRCEKVRAQNNADWGELRIIFNVLNLAPPFTLQGAGTKHAEIQSSVGEYTIASIGRMNGIKWIGRQLLQWLRQCDGRRVQKICMRASCKSDLLRNRMELLPRNTNKCSMYRWLIPYILTKEKYFYLGRRYRGILNTKPALMFDISWIWELIFIFVESRQCKIYNHCATFENEFSLH